MEHEHKPGSMKQQNKSHKARFKSKAAVRDESRGKVNKITSGGHKKAEQSKNDRRNRVKQLQRNKRADTLAEKRGFGGVCGAPQLILILPMSDTVDVVSIAARLMDSATDCGFDAALDTVTQYPRGTPVTFVSASHKQRISLLMAPHGDMLWCIEAARVADTLVCAFSASEVSDWAEKSLTCIRSQGLPAVAGVAAGLSDIPTKARQQVKVSLQKYFASQFSCTTSKVMSLDTASEAALVVRHLAYLKRKLLNWRDNHAYLVASMMEWSREECSEGDNETGVLAVSGYLRGRSLSPRGLVHLPGYGDFQISQIDGPKDPNPFRNSDGRQDGEVILAVSKPEERADQTSEATPDPMAGEQTWPTEEELEQAETDRLNMLNPPKQYKKVPKGVSSYHAAWILESDDENEEEDEGIEEQIQECKEMDEEMSDAGEDDVESEEEFETIEVSPNGANYDAQMADKEQDGELESYLLSRQEAMEENLLFPDEVTTPQDRAARERFARYRGLASFRHSEWDKYESLPMDYARIFQFQAFKRTKKRVLSESRALGQQDENLHGDNQMNIDSAVSDENSVCSDSVSSGRFVTVYLVKVPRAVIDAYGPSISEGTLIARPNRPVSLFGLLEYENKMCVMHYEIKRVNSYTEPIKSKERLVFFSGYRTFSAGAIFSEQSVKSDKHKFERFLQHGTPQVASVYAPIQFTPSPVIVFKEQEDGSLDLVATGAAMDADPHRLIIKRIILSGHPYMINKRSAIIRFMFFNRADIAWFKPIELWTKYGRKGHIKEPLGTHGHMKCIFDSQLKQQDTISTSKNHLFLTPQGIVFMVRFQHVNTDDHLTLDTINTMYQHELTLSLAKILTPEYLKHPFIFRTHHLLIKTLKRQLPIRHRLHISTKHRSFPLSLYRLVVFVQSYCNMLKQSMITQHNVGDVYEVAGIMKVVDYMGDQYALVHWKEENIQPSWEKVTGIGIQPPSSPSLSPSASLSYHDAWRPLSNRKEHTADIDNTNSNSYKTSKISYQEEKQQQQQLTEGPNILKGARADASRLSQSVTLC